MINLFNYLLVSNFFTSGFVLFTTPFEFYIGYIFMILFLVMYIFSFGRLEINRVFIFIFTLVTLLSLLNVFWGNDSFFSFLKQFGGFLFNGVVYYLLIRINKNNIDKIFRVYLKLAFIVAIIGIFQEFSFLIGFKYGYDYSYFIPKISLLGTVFGMIRIASILPEPAHFGAVMAPAMFVSVLNIVKRESNFISRKASFLITISILLSFSLVSYVGIVIALFLIMFNYKKIILIVACMSVLFAFICSAYLYIPDIRMRVDDTVSVITGNAPIDKGNASTFIFCSNAIIAYKSFLHNPLFGSGLGSHPMSYDRYIAQVIDPEKFNMGWDKKDASSLFSRLLSETGLMGVFLFSYFIVKFYVSKKKDAHFWIISNSILCLFILNLVRQGNYFYCGFIFFVWAYYFTAKSCV